MDVAEDVFRVFKWVQREQLTPWAGASCNARGAKLARLLRRTGATGLLNALRRNARLKRFYLGSAA